MWLFRPPNGILVAQRGKFWICASRELSGVMLSMNLYCEIILIALQQSLLSDSPHQRKSRSKNFTGTAINLEYQAYLQKIQSEFSWLSFWSNQLSLEASNLSVNKFALLTSLARDVTWRPYLPVERHPPLPSASARCDPGAISGCGGSSCLCLA